MQRTYFIQKLQQMYAVHPIVAVLGPRQCGKTTLAKQFAADYPGSVHHFDLEDPQDLARLTQPMLALQELEGLIIIDEVQRRPELFPILRVLVDKGLAQRFLILGSASRDLLQQSSESLAGRVAFMQLTPFTALEVEDNALLWLRGGFPRAYLAQDEVASYAWREAYISTFLERDIPNLGLRIAPRMLRRFWMMLSHYHGQIFNASEIGKSLGVAHTTARHYLDILVGTFMIRELAPWYANINKRQIKSSKIYFRDSGILHTLLGIKHKDALYSHVKLGASWEGFALEEILRMHQAQEGQAYFWGVHGQGELDLLLMQETNKLGFEFKYTDSVRLSKSMHLAVDTLALDSLTVIHPGTGDFPLADKIRAVGLQTYLQETGS